MRIFRTVPIFLVAIITVPFMGHGLEPDQVFERVSPSVVRFSSLESGGSGVVLTKGGLILTNYHVVNTPLPLQMTAKVKLADGRIAEQVFENVKVEKVHKEYDLALVQITEPGVSFAAANVISKDEKLRTGSKCYVIGNPDGGEAGNLDNSITAGLISSSSRTIDGLNYLQIDAAINPGNSGGAVALADGRVVGVVTFKLDGAEGVGFAIPTQSVSMDEFIYPIQKKGDADYALRLQEMGNEMLNRAGLAGSSEDKAFLTYMGLLYHRVALAELPNDPGMLFNVGVSYQGLNEEKIAVMYYQASIAIFPNFAPGRRNLGMIAAKNGNYRQAVDHWKQGALDTDESRKSFAANCLANWANYENSEKNYAAAAYLIQWADSLSKTSGEDSVNRRILEKRVTSWLSEEQVTFLNSKSGGYSKEDLAAFMEDAGEMVATTEGDSKEQVRPQAAGPGITRLLSYKATQETTLTHQLMDSNGRTYKLENPSDELSIDGDTITWTVAKGSKVQSRKILLSYEEGGETYYQVELFQVE